MSGGNSSKISCSYRQYGKLYCSLCFPTFKSTSFALCHSPTFALLMIGSWYPQYNVVSLSLVPLHILCVFVRVTTRFLCYGRLFPDDWACVASCVCNILLTIVGLVSALTVRRLASRGAYKAVDIIELCLCHGALAAAKAPFFCFTGPFSTWSRDFEDTGGSALRQSQPIQSLPLRAP